MINNRNNLLGWHDFDESDMCCVCGKQLIIHDACSYCGIFMGEKHLENCFITDNNGKYCKSCFNYHQTKKYIRR